MSEMLRTKRSRSNSSLNSAESTKIKRTKVDPSQELLDKATTVEPSVKINCAFCSRDISRTIRIICEECGNVEFCLDCLVLKKGGNGKIGQHCHDYHIVDKLDMNIFSKEWTAMEELTLLSSK